MKKTASKIIFALGLFFTFSLSYGHSTIDSPPTFRGTIKLPGNIRSSTDSLTIRYKAASDILVNYNIMRIVSDKNGDFSFKLPLSTIPYFTQILIKYKNGYSRLTEHYFSENGDNIFIEIIKGKDTFDQANTAIFSGHGSEKYNIAQLLGRLEEDFVLEASVLYDETKNIAVRLSSYAQAAIDFNERKVRLIQKLKLSSDMKKMITYEHGRIFDSWGLNISGFYRRNIPFRTMIRDNFNRYKNDFKYNVDPLMVFCPVFLKTLNAMEVQDEFINSSSEVLKIEPIYNALKNKYQGAIRERLLVNLFTNNTGLIKEVEFNESVFDSLANEGTKFVTTSSLKSMLVEQVRKNKGAVLFDASFSDIDGKDIDLKNLKGKVVLIDFWANGCSWCAIFHKFFQEKIHPQLKNNKDFVYLSVNASQNREQWMLGLKRGIYTSPDYLNVNIGKLGLKEPFALYYNITAIPFGLLIGKDGKIFSSNILRPDQTAKLINEALGTQNIDTSSL